MNEDRPSMVQKKNEDLNHIGPKTKPVIGYQVDILVWKTRSESGMYLEDVEYDLVEEYPITDWDSSSQDLKTLADLLESGLRDLFESMNELTPEVRQVVESLKQGTIEFVTHAQGDHFDD